MNQHPLPRPVDLFTTLTGCQNFSRAGFITGEFSSKLTILIAISQETFFPLQGDAKFHFEVSKLFCSEFQYLNAEKFPFSTSIRQCWLATFFHYAAISYDAMIIIRC